MLYNSTDMFLIKPQYASESMGDGQTRSSQAPPRSC